MVTHTQTIRQQEPANCLSVFAHFVGLAIKWLILDLICLILVFVVNFLHSELFLFKIACFQFFVRE